MALYTCVTPAAGTLCTGVAVSSADTVNANDINNGAILIVTTAATPTNVTPTDPGKTPAGTVAGSVTAVTVAANTSRAWGPNVLKNFIDPVTNLVTINYSATTNVTAMLVTDAD